MFKLKLYGNDKLDESRRQFNNQSFLYRAKITWLAQSWFFRNDIKHCFYRFIYNVTKKIKL